MAKVGRPSKYTPELGKIICDRIATGEGLAEILRSMPDTPHYYTVIGWLSTNDEFRNNYARAREAQAEWDADHIRTLAKRLEGCTSSDEASAIHKAAQLYQWQAGKRKPKSFGDKIHQEVSGEGGGPIKFIIETIPDTGGNDGE